jgi:hypothetical protein
MAQAETTCRLCRSLVSENGLGCVGSLAHRGLAFASSSVATGRPTVGGPGPNDLSDTPPPVRREWEA